MAIQLFCKKCKSGIKLDSRSLNKNEGKKKKAEPLTCPNCGETFTKQNRKYRVFVSYKGKRITRVVDNLTIARQVEASIKADLLRGDFDILQRKVPTLNEVFERFYEWAKNNKKTARNDMYLYKNKLQPVFGHKRLNQISPLDIERFKKDLYKSVNKKGQPFKPATIKHYLVLLKRLFNVSIKWGMYDGPNPVQKVKMPRLDNEIVAYLSDEEEQRLLDVLESWPYTMPRLIVKFALYTGLRRGEIFKLRWGDVDIEERYIVIRDPKGGISQLLPINQQAAEVLVEAEKYRQESPLVFPGKDGKQRSDFKTSWKKIKQAAKLPETFRFHDLRHHFASRLVSNGIDLYTVSRLLTHKDVKTSQRYAHIADEALRAASEKAGAIISRTGKQNVVILRKRNTR